MARMHVLKFCVYTVIGATLWNSFLLWVGWKLEEKWVTILRYRQPLDIAVVAVIVVGVIAWFWLHLKKPKAAVETTETKV